MKCYYIICLIMKDIRLKCKFMRPIQTIGAKSHPYLKKLIWDQVSITYIYFTYGIKKKIKKKLIYKIQDLSFSYERIGFKRISLKWKENAFNYTLSRFLINLDENSSYEPIDENNLETCKNSLLKPIF